MMKKVLFLVCVVVSCVFAKKVECNKLLNCLTCSDESHCETCPEGYVLDSKSVCRYDCAAKYGLNCSMCTPTRCICGSSEQVWNIETGKCVDVKDCTDSDPAVCTYCGLGFDLMDMTGKCSTCAAVFGAGCQSCSDSKCTAAAEGYKICGGVAVSSDADCPTECGSLFPGCTKCAESGDACEECAEAAELVDGFCKYKFPTCESGQKPLYINGALTCGNCQSFDENCIASRCSGRACTKCKPGFAITAAGGCLNCSTSFPGCAICQEDACTKCGSSAWVLTPNGCFNQNPYVPQKEDNSGMIAGIVIAALVLVAIVVLAVYCIVSSTAKHGQIDPSLYEDDLEFKSVSVL